MTAALSQILTIFLAILAGFVCRRLGVLTEEATSSLSNVVVKIILPFYLFSSILRTDAGVDPLAIPVTLLLSAGMFLLSALVQSSSISILGRVTSARARARRCFWPPDRFTPPCSSQVS